MQARTFAVRAIAATYIDQNLKSLRIGILAVLAGLFVFVGFLSIHYSAWWLLFVLPLLLFTVLFIIASSIAGIVVRTIMPMMSPSQKTAAKDYVSNMNEVTAKLQTPKYLIAWKIVLDMFARRWQGSFIQQTTAKSTRLTRDFDRLVELYTV